MNLEQYVFLIFTDDCKGFKHWHSHGQGIKQGKLQNPDCQYVRHLRVHKFFFYSILMCDCQKLRMISLFQLPSSHKVNLVNTLLTHHTLAC